MRRVCLGALAAVWACGGYDALREIPANAGAAPVADTGVPAAPPQGGADAGPPAAPAGAGTDGGIAVSPCDGLAPSAQGMRSISIKGRPALQPDGAVVDGAGTLALLQIGWVDTEIQLIAPDGTIAGWSIVRWNQGIEPLARGFATTSYLQGSVGAYATQGLAPDGTQLGGTYFAYGIPSIAAPAFGTSFLMAGTFRENYPAPAKPQALWVDVTKDPVIVASVPLDGDFVGAGADGTGNSLVVFRQMQGAFKAQWFGPGARPLTGRFALPGIELSASTSIDVSPAAGGGVVVSRIEYVVGWSDFRIRPQCLLAAGATRCVAAPQWMQSRPEMRFLPVRGGRARAAVTRWRDGMVDCADTVEVFTLDGKSCGSVELRIAAGTCSRLNLTVGPEGTVVQSLPRDVPLPDSDHLTWRWWPGMLR